jgi:uncharacterized membrane protein YkvA (DUF1232 family)
VPAERMEEDRVVIELNPKERRLYDRLRAQIVEPGPVARSGARDLLLLFPDLVMLLHRLMWDPRVPVGSKLLAALGLAYVLSPLDLLPGLLLGPIGLLDDLIVVGAVLSRMINRVHPDVVRSHWPGRGDALQAIHRVSQWTETQMTNRVKDVLRMARISGRVR